LKETERDRKRQQKTERDRETQQTETHIDRQRRAAETIHRDTRDST